ncbi:MAG: Vps62-related protein [Chloroflexi bacterium]|nr:Vps62-related protein [Chloroflexota bacterium]
MKRHALLTMAGLAAIALASCGESDVPPATATPAPSAAQQLVAKFAPVLFLHPDDPYEPRDVAIMVDNSSLRRSLAAQTDEVIAPTVAADALGQYNDPDLYLDLEAATLGDGAGAYATWYLSVEADYAPTVYARVVSIGDKTVVQYWFFYVFNDWINRHEGDWEMIEVILPGGDAEEIVNADALPSTVAYSQHGEGTREDWASVERLGTHPKVYVARGSHANYFRPGEYQQLLWLDQATGGGLVIAPEGLEGVDSTGRIVYHGPVLLGDVLWLAFPGHWGERSIAPGFDSPLGPAYQGVKWDTPLAWAEALPDDSERR